MTPQAAPPRYGLCDYLYVSACMRTEGTLSPCYFGPALLGLTDTFRTVWNNPIMQQLRRDHDTAKAHTLCKNCCVFTDGGGSVDSRKRQFLKNDALTA